MNNSSITPREYELVNATSSAENERKDPTEQQDGVWIGSEVRHVRSRYEGHSKFIGLLICVLVVGVVVIAVSCGGRGEGDHDVPAGESIHQDASTIPPSPSVSPTVHPAISTKYNCQGDRIQNGVKLETNHYICDVYNRYRFGMDESGSLVYADDAFNMTAIIYNGTKGDYFELLQNGSFTVSNSTGITVWQEECENNVSFSAQCLPTHHEVYDCPYLHLHSGGTIVLNWISGGWKVRNILHMYDFPKCHDHFFCYPDSML